MKTKVSTTSPKAVYRIQALNQNTDTLEIFTTAFTQRCWAENFAKQVRKLGGKKVRVIKDND